MIALRAVIPSCMFEGTCNIWGADAGILGVVAEQTMDVVEMVLGGRVNKGLVTLIQQSGGRAVGLCGKDNSIIKARQMVEKDIGFVGEVTKVDSSLLETLVRDGFTPVVASVAADENGQALNVNADIAAGEVSIWGHEHLILFFPSLQYQIMHYIL